MSPARQSPDPAAFLAALRQDQDLGPKFGHVQRIEPRDGSYLEPAAGLHPLLEARLREQGLRKLYRHQALALDSLRQGRHATVVTPTASGKTLTFLLPVLESLIQDPQSRALFLFPIKALAQDQMGNVGEWLEYLNLSLPPAETHAPLSSPGREARGGGRKKGGGERFTAAIYDGDTPQALRAKLRRKPPNILISNPDMLHLGMLPYHPGWAEFWKGLRYIVVDEAHSYRGIFGAHAAWIFRRLKRVAALYGAHPQFILLSATIANAQEFGDRLVGESCAVIEANGAPAAARHFTLWQSEDSPYREATELFGRMVKAGFKTIAFTKARKITELMARWTWEAWPELKERTKAYRAGYLPEERRAIEQALFGGKLDGVIATSALELGIDVGGLDACILVGYPGTMISTWQRVGRVGRDGRESLVFLLPLQDAIDQYFVRHPDFFFSKPFEQALVPVENRVIRSGHLACAAEELPITAAAAQEEALLGPDLALHCDELWRAGVLRQSGQGIYHASGKRVAGQISIRSAGDGYAIAARGRAGAPARVIGTIEPPRVFRDCHPGAVYLHGGLQYKVMALDLPARRVEVEEASVEYYTEPRGTDDIEILDVRAGLRLGGGVAWRFGTVRATEQVTGYVMKHLQTRAVLSEARLEMPKHTYETEAAWWELPRDWRAEFAAQGMDFSGAIHALEHAQIAMLPLMVLCDRWDLGGVSYWSQPQLDTPAVFVYDGHAGGADLAARGFERVKEWLAAVRALLKDCPCEEGCPACVQSPKCGNGNNPLDKRGAIELARRLAELVEQGGEAMEEKKAALDSPTGRPTDGPQRQPPVAVEHLGGADLMPDPSELAAGAGDTLVFDLETQFLSNEVGGWGNTHLMKVSVAVAWSERQQRFLQYHEAQVPELVSALGRAGLVVGFNHKSFDFSVLQPYAPDVDFAVLPSLDLLEEVRKNLGFRVSLDALAKATLGAEKSADGLQAVAWWRAGQLGPLMEYCQQDVALTRDLWRFGRQHGYLLYHDKQGALMKVAVKW